VKTSLALTLRPKSLDEVVGQKHLLSKDAPFRKLLENDALPHSFFFGPPGSGKTTIINVITSLQDRPCYALNATSLKIEDIRSAVKKHRGEFRAPIIFIDEVHRLSKTQQEVLLPFMEEEVALVLGASTENPYFSLTNAIRSRSILFELKPLKNDELEEILNRVENSKNISQDGKEYLIKSSNGDARAMLNLLELALECEKTIDKELLKTLRPTSMSTGASSDDEAFNLISALIKSIRGSDENASIYYLARLISEGENPEYIARRLVILASEDIGNANPNALNLAVSAMQSVAKIGYPEARIILSQAVIYLCASPKSNLSYKAINEAIKLVEEGKLLPIPKNIAHFNEGYKYPHDFGGYVKQNYLSEPLKVVNWKGAKGFEIKQKEWLDTLKA